MIAKARFYQAHPLGGIEKDVLALRPGPDCTLALIGFRSYNDDGVGSPKNYEPFLSWGRRSVQQPRMRKQDCIDPSSSNPCAKSLVA